MWTLNWIETPSRILPRMFYSYTIKKLQWIRSEDVQFRLILCAASAVSEEVRRQSWGDVTLALFTGVHQAAAGRGAETSGNSTAAASAWTGHATGEHMTSCCCSLHLSLFFSFFFIFIYVFVCWFVCLCDFIFPVIVYFRCPWVKKSLCRELSVEGHFIFPDIHFYAFF